MKTLDPSTEVSASKSVYISLIVVSPNPFVSYRIEFHSLLVFQHPW